MTAASPRIVCIACEAREVGMYDLVCSTCRPQLEAAGLIRPAPAVPVFPPPSTPPVKDPHHAAR